MKKTLVENVRQSSPPKRSPDMDDSWILDLVDDPETDMALSKLAVEDAVEDQGLSRQEAERLFLPTPPDRRTEPEIDVDDLCRMTMDIVRGRRGPHIRGAAASTAWSSLKQDIEEIIAQGGIVDLPPLEGPTRRSRPGPVE